MDKHIFHEEIGGGYGMRRKTIIDTSEIEPGKYETMALVEATGDELDSAIADNPQDAERDFRAMIQRHAGPLQAAFYQAGLVPGQHYTMIYLGEFGFPACLRMTFHGAKLDTYAQYDDAVNLTFTPYRARQKRRMFLYNRSFLIYAGWRDLDVNATFDKRDSGNGVTAMVSKYCCFDERFMDDIKAAWPDYIAAYTRKNDEDDCEGDDAKAAAAPRVQEEFELLPGLKVIRNAEGIGKTCVDLNAEDFATLYAPPEGDDPGLHVRLTRALWRAAIASVVHIDDDDGGTCNFDSPALDFSACGITKEAAETVIKSIGLNCRDWQPFKNHRGDDGKIIKAPTFLVISGFQCGQGYRHTHMAEAFCNSMNADGFETQMYYQVD